MGMVERRDVEPELVCDLSVKGQHAPSAGPSTYTNEIIEIDWHRTGELISPLYLSEAPHQPRSSDSRSI